MSALKEIIGSILLCSFLFNSGIDADLNKVDDKYENKLFFYFSESGYDNNDWKYRDPRVLVTYYKD